MSLILALVCAVQMESGEAGGAASLGHGKTAHITQVDGADGQGCMRQAAG